MSVLAEFIKVKCFLVKFQEPLNPHQGDRQGRPYNMTLPVLPDRVYCRGDPGGIDSRK